MTCGSPLVAGAVAAVLPAWKEKYAQNYFRGQVKSNKGDVWTFENGEVKGKDISYAWIGDTLRQHRGEHPEFGWASFDGKTLTWRFEDMNGSPLISWELLDGDNEVKSVQRCALGASVKDNWLHCVKREGETGVTVAEVPEGAEERWDATGDVPWPVVVLCSTWKAAQIMHKKWQERNARSYQRCGKLVLAAAPAGQGPRICAECAKKKNGCSVCGVEQKAAPPHAGQVCKSCAPKKGLCVRCADPLKGSQVPALLCDGCGLGSRGMNCCKLNF